MPVPSLTPGAPMPFMGEGFQVHATLPRLRYDRLMKFGWKVLLPVATANLLVTAIVVGLMFAN